ncbi:MAG: hypothetical protein QM831_05465 [Kofleriaceae bacterium]
MKLALALLCVASTAFAGDNSKSIGKLSITAPKDWNLAAKPQGITGESKDKEVALLVWSLDGNQDAAAAEKKLEGELYSAIASIKWDAVTSGKAHDLSATYLSGQGHAKGGDIVVKASLVGPLAGANNAKTWMLVACAVHTDKLEAHKTEIQSIFDSVNHSK